MVHEQRRKVHLHNRPQLQCRGKVRGNHSRRQYTVRGGQLRYPSRVPQGASHHAHARELHERDTRVSRAGHPHLSGKDVANLHQR